MSREWSGWKFRLRALLSRSRMESELEEEMQFHLEQEARKEQSDGGERAEAERTAHARFGPVGRHKDTVRQAWGVRLMDELAVDLGYALRQFSSRPAFSAVAVGTLAMGVGSTLALLGAAYGLFLQPLPYTHEDSVHVFWSDFSWSAAELTLARETTTGFESVAAFTHDDQTWQRGEGAEMLEAALVTGNALDVLGAGVARGRSFELSDEVFGAPPTAIVSHSFWQQRLGGDAEVVGTRLDLDGESVAIVGVLPDGFFFPSPAVDLWRPLPVDPTAPGYRGNHWLTLFARHATNLPQHVTSDLKRFATALDESFDYPPAWDKTKTPAAQPVREYLLGSARTPLLLLVTACLLLLGMSAVNAAALMLARMADRNEELSARRALGAGRARLTRQLITEALVLGSASSALGLTLAALGLRWLRPRLPLPVGFEDVLTLGWPLALGALATAPLLAVVVVAGPLKALWSHTQGGPSARSRRGLRGSRSPAQRLLIVAEIAVAVVLVTSAAVLARSVLEIYAVDLGFDTAGVVVVDLFAPSAALDAGARSVYFEQLTESLSTRPQIDRAAIANRIPLRDSGVQGPLRVETRPDLDDGSLNCKWRYVTADYFETVGTGIVSGRGFSAIDTRKGVQVGIIGARLARTLWTDDDPIGQRVRTGYSADWIEIVGIADDVHHDGVLGEPSNVLYRPLAQVQPWESARLLLRTSLDAPAALQTAREASQRLDPRVALARPSSMRDIVRGDLSQPLRLRFFLATFSVLALVIGAVGIYGVVSFVVSRRTREYGLRLALGAQPRELLTAVLADGARLVLFGTVLGLAGAWLGWRLLAGLLVGVTGSSPADYATAAAVLLAVGLAASLSPALRAARVDPIRALDTP